MRLSHAHDHLQLLGLDLRMGCGFSAQELVSMKNKIILAGGTGFIGQSLGARLAAKGYEVVGLTRSPSRRSGRARYVHWDAKTIGPWVHCLDGAKSVVNLTGKS